MIHRDSNSTATPVKRRVAATVGVAAASLAAVVLPAGTSNAQPTVCTAEMLNVTTVERPSDSPSQSHLDIVLTNTSAEACGVQGFPGVDLVGPDDPTFGPTYSLPRQDAGFAPVMVEPGSAVASTLTYLPGGPDDWVPDTVVVIPPDTTTPMDAPWPEGVSVQRQDGATHPGTYISPLKPA